MAARPGVAAAGDAGVVNAERFLRVDALFAQALELPVEARAAFLAEVCGDDDDLHRQLEELLAADSKASGFLESASPSPELGVGTWVGPYQLESLLGRGGMGAVYLARRADLDRPVALKLVDSPFRHPELVPRFHAERQILARLEHPGIARLYDAGETADGVPYLVLEYVDGEPLDRYCDRLELDLGARVELFRKLLDAVAHAHQSLLIHRDIKPSNVLVRADGQVKLLDFGIAQRVDRDLGAASATSSRPMTPAYASPEQVRGEPLTTATDIYSLGVVFYELLAGRRPYRVKSDLPHELEAAILEQEPERPSAASVPWRRQLAGDLDTIVLTALDKDPAKRYRSVLELQADLERWSDFRPIAARPPSRTYRLAKFVRRHRVGVAAGVLGAALGLGLVVSLFQERNRAARERDRAQEALSFVVSVFTQDSPYLQGSREVTAREILGAAKDRAETELTHDPDLQAELFRVLGQATAGIGRYPEAQALLARSLEAVRDRSGASPALARNLEAIGWVEYLQGDFEAALPHLEEAVGLRRRLQPGSPELSVALQLLGNVLIEHDRESESPELERTERLFQESLLILERLEPGGGPGTEASLAGLVKVASRRRNLGPAEVLARQVLEMTRRRNGERHTATATTERSLAQILVDQGQFDEAETLVRQALASLESLLPADHPEITTAVSDLGMTVLAAGRLAEAEPLLRRAYDESQARLGPDHPTTLASLTLLANTLQNLGRNADAVPLRERALAAETRVHGEESLPVAYTLSVLGQALATLGEFERAEVFARRGLTLIEKLREAGHPEIGRGHRYLGAVLLKAGKPAEAEGHLRKGLVAQRKDFGVDFYQTASLETALATCLMRLGRLDEAGELLNHAVAVLEKQFSADHPLVLGVHRAQAELAAARSGGR
jgi:eukaryotic-like serine/threonine-protein kinase